LQSNLVAGNAHRRRGAAFHADDLGVVGQIARYFLAEAFKALTQRVDDKLGEERAHISRGYARMVRCVEHTGRLSASEEIAEALGRGGLALAGDCPGFLLDLRLKLHGGERAETVQMLVI